jgi:hypothetical protein
MDTSHISSTVPFFHIITPPLSSSNIFEYI